jgi:hypothetical protein
MLPLAATIAAITGSASAAENDNDRDTHNVKLYLQEAGHGAAVY